MSNDIQWDSYWGSVDRSYVDQLERQIGVQFPSPYREIVTQHNGAIADKSVYKFYNNLTQEEAEYGLGLMHPFGPPASSTQETESMEYQLANRPDGFPGGLVSFARDGGGNLICFDYRGNPHTSDPAIVLWQSAGSPGSDEEVSLVAQSFSAFLDMLTLPEDFDL